MCIDVQDLYYSMPFDDLLKSVRLCITEDNDEIRFSNNCGVSVNTFMEILSFYLESTFVEWKGKFYVQKTGVCIGSKVAPVLSNIFLGKMDRQIDLNLGGAATKIVRYVDDFLVFVKSDSLRRRVSDVLSLFEQYGRGLSFTVELPKENELQFLDLRLFREENHVCWAYVPRSKKPILNFNSGHSKVVKMGIAASCLRSAITKSCSDRVSTSFHNQLDRLNKAGFQESVVRKVVLKLIKCVKSNWAAKEKDSEKQPTKQAVIPYVHKLAHGLKNVANRFDVRVVFSAPNKLNGVCSKVDRLLSNSKKCTRKRNCGVEHNPPFVRCATCVVYCLPLNCGHIYVGQTGRCLNIRLQEHRSSVKSKDGSNLAKHCSACGCTPIFCEASVLSKFRDKTTREVIESFHIKRCGKRCVSAPSLNLTDKEYSYLCHTLRN